MTQDHEQQSINGREALCAAVLTFIANGRHQLLIFAYDLDPLIYSNDDFATQLSGLARKSRRPDIRILLHQPTRLLSEQHRALPIIQQLSSLIEVRQLHDQYQQQWQSYLINDQPAMLYQPTYKRYDAILVNEASDIVHNRKQFEQMWQQSDVATQLRRQMI